MLLVARKVSKLASVRSRPTKSLGRALQTFRFAPIIVFHVKEKVQIAISLVEGAWARHSIARLVAVLSILFSQLPAAIAIRFPRHVGRFLLSFTSTPAIAKVISVRLMLVVERFRSCTDVNAGLVHL